MDGTYGFVYSGATGVGIGAFTVKDGVLTGSDGGQANNKGTVAVDDVTGNFVITFDQFVPAGTFLVQGTSPLEVDSTRTRTIPMPPGFGDGEPVSVDLPPGTVTLMVKRVPDKYAPFASGFTITPV
jgi:hypothetical protein